MNSNHLPAFTTIEQLDPILGPTSASHSGSAPQATVLAILAKGHRHKIPAKLVRTWIKSRLVKRPEVVAIATSNAWNGLVRISREWLRSQDERSSSSSAAAVARRGLARVLSEIRKSDRESATAVSGTLQIAARHAMAVMTLAGIEAAWKGKDCFNSTHPWLAVQRGTTKLSARHHFKLLTELGWVRVVSGGRPGMPAWVKLPRLPAKVGALVEGEERYAQIGAISVQEEPEDLLAAVFRSAAHPAWTYSPDLKPAHWLVLLADAAGVDPTSLGVASARVAKIRKGLFVLLGEPDERTAEGLALALDDHAVESGAFVRFTAAEEARRIAAAERKEAAEAIRAEKKAAAEAKAAEAKAQKVERKVVTVEDRKSATNTPTGAPVDPRPFAELTAEEKEAAIKLGARVLAKLVQKFGSLPASTDGLDPLRTWIGQAEPLLASCSRPLREVVAKLLFAEARSTGWDDRVSASLMKRALMAGGEASQAAA